MNGRKKCYAQNWTDVCCLSSLPYDSYIGALMLISASGKGKIGIDVE